MDKQNILLINIGNFEKEFLEDIAGDVKKEYSIPVSVQESYIDLSEFFDPMRRQYDANKLMKEFGEWSFASDTKSMSLLKVDLFIPILTYIFGQAILSGNIGIASLHRLRNEQYGMKKDELLLQDRFKKVINHELGHMFGLLHCHNPSCVMRSSTYVEDIDQKERHLCPKCRNELHMKSE